MSQYESGKGKGEDPYTVMKISRKYYGRISAEVNKDIFKVTVEIPKHKFA